MSSDFPVNLTVYRVATDEARGDSWTVALPVVSVNLTDDWALALVTDPATRTITREVIRLRDLYLSREDAEQASQRWQAERRGAA